MPRETEPLTPETKHAIRQRAFECWNETALRREFKLTFCQLRNVLEAAWVDDTRRCRTCDEVIRYKWHVDHPRHYHRCAECAASDWNERLVTPRRK